jgi:ankyrin repeat protein
MIKAEVVDTTGQGNEGVPLLTSASLSTMSQEELINVLGSNKRIFVPKSMLGDLLSQPMLGAETIKSLGTGEGTASSEEAVPSPIDGVLLHVEGTSLGTLVGAQNNLPTANDLCTIDPATLELPSSNNNTSSSNNDKAGNCSIGNSPKERALMLAAKSSDYQGLVQALEDGADVLTARDPRCGATALHYVAVTVRHQTNSHSSTATRSDGACPSVPADGTMKDVAAALHAESSLVGSTNLYREEGCPMIELLLTSGADATASASNGSTALHWAAGAGNLRAIRSLVRGAPTAAPVASDRAEGEEPASLYARSYTWGRQVFGKGSGQTPLHWAAESGQDEAVKLLLALDTGGLGEDGGMAMAGALSFAQDERGQTAQALAEKEGHTFCEELLKAHEKEEYVCVAFTTEQSVIQADRGHVDEREFVPSKVRE